jgi:hypothetical protein
MFATTCSNPMPAKARMGHHMPTIYNRGGRQHGAGSGAQGLVGHVPECRVFAQEGESSRDSSRAQ